MNQEEERNGDLHARCAMLKGTAVKDKDLLVKNRIQLQSISLSCTQARGKEKNTRRFQEYFNQDKLIH